jgi:hypothetical protein
VSLRPGPRRACWVALRYCWVALRYCWVALTSRWVALANSRRAPPSSSSARPARAQHGAADALCDMTPFWVGKPRLFFRLRATHCDARPANSGTETSQVPSGSKSGRNRSNERPHDTQAITIQGHQLPAPLSSNHSIVRCGVGARGGPGAHPLPSSSRYAPYAPRAVFWARAAPPQEEVAVQSC